MKKRIFDIVFSIGGLVLVFPLFLLIAVFAALTSRRPIFVSDKLYGKDFHLFSRYRFNRGGGLADPQAADPDRLGKGVPFGALLCRLRLDKLPELINVLKGEMSVVGPRPVRPDDVHPFEEDFKIILQTRPGMVDLTSAGLEETLPPLHQRHPQHPAWLLRRVKLAKDYIFHRTFVLDLQIVIAATVNLILAWPFPGTPKSPTLRDVLITYRGAIVFGLHLSAAVFSNYYAFSLRYDANIPDATLVLFMRTLPMLVLFRLGALHLLGLHVKLWRYVGTMDMVNIGMAAALSSGLLWVVIKAVPLEGYSRSVMVVDAVLFSLILAALRCTKSIYKRATRVTTGARKVLIIGAGNAGAMIARDLQQNPAYDRTPIAFIDDDPHKQNVTIHGIPVMGACDTLDIAVKKVFAEEIIVALPSASPAQIKTILNRCKPLGLPIKIIPNLPALFHGRVSMSDLRVLDIEDLVGRPEITIAKEEVEKKVTGKRVLVTGAGGSIGSELCRQIAAFHPERLILYEQSENNLYHIALDLKTRFPGIRVVAVLADILDTHKVEQVFSQHTPQMVFHAAAYKHVPLMEENPAEAVRNNIVGTANIIDASVRHQAEEFVLISTDKAVCPTSVMGATKRIAEMVVQYFSSRVSTRLLTVRFGNVLESNGSVVPLFRSQIKRGGPVTVTDAEVKRYFITIHEAVQLVLQAAVLGEGGEVFVLDMGEPYKILDLAKTMIILSGFTPHLDIPIQFVGLRPGEKLTEELFEKSEEIKSTRHPKISIAQNGKMAHDVPEYLARLTSTIEQAPSPHAIRALLKELLPSYTHFSLTPGPDTQK